MFAVCLYGFTAHERAAVQEALELSEEQMCVKKTLHTHGERVAVVNANAVYGFLNKMPWPERVILYGALSEKEEESFGERFPHRVYYEDWERLRSLLQSW